MCSLLSTCRTDFSQELAAEARLQFAACLAQGEARLPLARAALLIAAEDDAIGEAASSSSSSSSCGRLRKATAAAAAALLVEVENDAIGGATLEHDAARPHGCLGQRTLPDVCQQQATSDPST
jgi:hypothetical protein